MQQQHSAKRTNRVEIQWRVAPQHVDRDTRDEDRRWTRHSFVPSGQGDVAIEQLAKTQSENGYFEFRVRS